MWQRGGLRLRLDNDLRERFRVFVRNFHASALKNPKVSVISN
jgi:hypothetical protein